MAAFPRVLPKNLAMNSLCDFGRKIPQRFSSFCFRDRSLYNYRPRDQSWLVRRSWARGITHSSDKKNIKAHRVITPITAELLRSVQYGKEQWMSSAMRNYLVGKIEGGIIDPDSTDKLTLEHFQVFWPRGKPIWTNFQRNFKGQFPPQKTRRNCFAGTKVCSNPCPICQLKAERNYELVYTDVGLLSQFICPHTEKILETIKTGVCQKQHKLLTKAIIEARDKGLIPYMIPGPRDPLRVFQPVGVPSMFKNRK
ncbi:uncharacterized protein [Pocillopora verrucosa]|uniref:uncharacterized protein n=1 Tax=Pocillopora verrucosa TaxID=203993 RepID=UPI00334139C9